MGRSLNDLSINDDSAAFSDCNSDRSGEFSTASSQSRRLLVACGTENSDELIRQLVSGLEASSIEDQKQVAMEIRLLAKNKSENQIKIARAGAIKPLILLISSSDPQLQEYGVNAILNLSLCDENKELIASSGSIKPLVRALKVGTSTARENAACAHLIKWQVREFSIPISRAPFSCDSQPVLHCFLDGSICVFCASNLELQCRLCPIASLSSRISSRVYPQVIAAYPQPPNKFAVGLTDGRIHVYEPLEMEGQRGTPPPADYGLPSNVRTASPAVADSESPSNNQEESSEDAHIYIRAETSDGLCHWYVIEDLEDTGRHKSLDELEFLCPVFDDGNDMEYKQHCACVALGSVIYVLGGYQSWKFSPPLAWLDESPKGKHSATTNNVYYIDTLRPETGWTRAPPMLMERSHAHAFTLDGKIYIMGGFVSDSYPLPLPPYYAEVFDPSQKESGWQPAFSDIPKRLARGNVFVHQLTLTETQKQLLVYGVAPGLGSLYTYNFDHKLWNICYKGDFGPRRCISCTFLDDIMYCYDCLTLDNARYTARGTIMGFDVKNPNIPPKIVRGLEEEKDFLPKPDFYDHFPLGNLLYLGGAKLCLVLQEYIPRRNEGFIMTFLKFTVLKEQNSSGKVVDLVASHLSKSSCCLDATFINNCFAMPAFGGKGAEEVTSNNP